MNLKDKYDKITQYNKLIWGEIKELPPSPEPQEDKEPPRAVPEEPQPEVPELLRDPHPMPEVSIRDVMRAEEEERALLVRGEIRKGKKEEIIIKKDKGEELPKVEVKETSLDNISVEDFEGIDEDNISRIERLIEKVKIEDKKPPEEEYVETEEEEELEIEGKRPKILSPSEALKIKEELEEKKSEEGSGFDIGEIELVESNQELEWEEKEIFSAHTDLEVGREAVIEESHKRELIKKILSGTPKKVPEVKDQLPRKLPIMESEEKKIPKKHRRRLDMIMEFFGQIFKRFRK